MVMPACGTFHYVTTVPARDQWDRIGQALVRAMAAVGIGCPAEWTRRVARIGIVRCCRAGEVDSSPL
jgi:hypothetical protein